MPPEASELAKLAPRYASDALGEIAVTKSAAGKRTLVFRDAQHEYAFTEE